MPPFLINSLQLIESALSRRIPERHVWLKQFLL